MDEQFQDSIDIDYNVRNEKTGSMHARSPEKISQNPRMNILLFIITLFTTTIAGALSKVDPSEFFWGQLYKGLPFSLTLLAILLFHEFGHYFMARKHRVDATLPYFIPGIPIFIGTFGAVIKMRSPLHSKRALFDIGAAGPLAGVVVAIPAIIIGLRLSEIREITNVGSGISLGSSLLLSLLTRISVGILPEHQDILLHPIAFAGWVGLLVTMLNLLPVGQLDGGHVTYAVLGHQRHQKIAAIILPLLFIMGLPPIPYLLLKLGMEFDIISGGIGFIPRLEQWFQWLSGYGWLGWLIWFFILRSIIGKGHPPTMDDHLPLDTLRKVIGWIALALFILTFTPVPFPLML